MKHIVALLSALLAMAAAPAWACKVADGPEPFEVRMPDQSEGADPAPVPDISVDRIERGTRGIEGCEMMGRLVFRLENPGDYGLIFENGNGDAPFRFYEVPRKANEELDFSWDDGESRTEEIEHSVVVTPINRDGVMGDSVELLLSDNGRTCSAGGAGGLSIWAICLGLLGLARRRSSRQS